MPRPRYAIRPPPRLSSRPPTSSKTSPAGPPALLAWCTVGGALALWWWLAPKKAYALEIDKKYRYEVSIEPPLPDTNAALRLGGAIADESNTHITVSTTAAAYDVQQPRTTELVPGHVLTTFEGSNLVFRTATRLPD